MLFAQHRFSPAAVLNMAHLSEEIARLSSTERAMLIDILWESLDEALVKEIEEKMGH